MNTPALMPGLQDKIRERIQASFMDLIPEDAWRELVHREVQTFVANNLPTVVREAAIEHVRRLIVEELKRPEWRDHWSQDGLLAGPALQKILADAAPALVSALFSSMGQQIVQAIRNGQFSGRY